MPRVEASQSYARRQWYRRPAGKIGGFQGGMPRSVSSSQALFEEAQNHAGVPPAGGRGAAPHGEPTGTWHVPRIIWPLRPHVDRRGRRQLRRPALWRNHLMDVSMVEPRWWQLRRAFVVSLVESREDAASHPSQHSRQGLCESAHCLRRRNSEQESPPPPAPTAASPALQHCARSRRYRSGGCCFSLKSG